MGTGCESMYFVVLHTSPHGALDVTAMNVNVIRERHWYKYKLDHILIQKENQRSVQRAQWVFSHGHISDRRALKMTLGCNEEEVAQQRQRMNQCPLCLESRVGSRSLREFLFEKLWEECITLLKERKREAFLNLAGNLGANR